MINSYWFFKLHFIQIQHHISSSNSIFAYSRLHFKFRNWICFFFSVHFRMMLNPPIQKASGIYIRHWICDCVIMYEMCQSICSYSVWWWFLKQQYVNHVFTSVDERPLLSLTSIQSLSSILPPRATLQASASANIQAQDSWRCWKCLMVLGGWISTKPVALAVFRMEYQHTALYILHIAYYFFLNSTWKCMQCATF